MQSPTEKTEKSPTDRLFGIRLFASSRSRQTRYTYGDGASFRPGTVVAHRNGAVLVGAGQGGALWIGHAKARKDTGGRGLKLPAIAAVRRQLTGVRELTLHPDQRRGCPRTHQIIRYLRVDDVGWVHATPFNGACSTTFCGRLLACATPRLRTHARSLSPAAGRRGITASTSA